MRRHFSHGGLKQFSRQNPRLRANDRPYGRSTASAIEPCCRPIATQLSAPAEHVLPNLVTCRLILKLVILRHGHKTPCATQNLVFKRAVVEGVR